MPAFVWTKIGAESGEDLSQILQRKEAERVAGKGEFWWGIGNSLGTAVRETAGECNGEIPVLFSKILGRSKSADASPDEVWRWTAWEDHTRRVHSIPTHVKVISRGTASKLKHYALVCYSDAPIAGHAGGKRFDPNLCRTLSGKVPGSTQVTALLRGSADGHSSGAMRSLSQRSL